jgi:hypothetical protein
VPGTDQRLSPPRSFRFPSRETESLAAVRTLASKFLLSIKIFAISEDFSEARVGYRGGPYVLSTFVGVSFSVTFPRKIPFN